MKWLITVIKPAHFITFIETIFVSVIPGNQPDTST